jgi:PmbA protein
MTTAPASSGTTAELVALAEKVVAEALPGEQLEAYVASGTRTSVRAYEGEVESFTSASTAGVGIRVIVDDRVGFAHAGSLNQTVIQETLAEARDNAQFAEPDPTVALVAPDGVEPVEQDQWRDEAVTFADDAKIDMALELERAVRSGDPRISGIRSAGFSSGFGSSAMASTTGIRASGRSTGSSMSVSALALDGDQTRSGFGVTAGRSPSELDLQQAADDAIERATSLLGATKPASAEITLVLEPRMAMTLLGMVAGTLSAERLQKGRALFGGREGEEIASPLITLVDDPTDSRSLAADSHDGEGLATRPNPLITNGVLHGFLHNSITARRGNTSSTASAVRGYASTPGVGPQVLVMEPGSTAESELLNGISHGLFVHSFSGLHSGVNTTSGDFSVGVEGLLIRNGELAEPVSEATAASTIQRLLRDVAAIGDDFTWLPGGDAACTMVISGVTLSGS